jgi:hypothetical protein
LDEAAVFGGSVMHIDWTAFFGYLRDNRVSISLYGSVFFTAVVVTMPENPPRSFQDMWTWSRNALSRHFNLAPKSGVSTTETKIVTTATSTDPAKDAVSSPKV